MHGHARILNGRPKREAKLIPMIGVRVTRRLLGIRDAPSLEVALAFLLKKDFNIQPSDEMKNKNELEALRVKMEMIVIKNNRDYKEIGTLSDKHIIELKKNKIQGCCMTAFRMLFRMLWSI